MNFEQTVTSVSDWLALMSAVVDNNNARHNDHIVLKMPRSGDRVVTFRDDPQAAPEQAPAIVVELQGSAWDLPLAGTFKGGVAGSLYLLDGGTSVADVRTKLSRWVDVLMVHCRDNSSIFANGRVVPRNIQFLMGKTRDLNGFTLKLDFVLPIAF